MRRKNMLALGMSLVFCATAIAVPLYANPLDHQEITVSEEKETSKNQAENSVVVTVEYKNTDLEEGSKESLADFPGEPEKTGSTEAVEPAEETELAEESALREDVSAVEETSMVKPLSLGYSSFRMANANADAYTLKDKIFTPGEYRYIYTLAVGKNSPYYLVPKVTPDNDVGFTYTQARIGNRFADDQSNESNNLEIKISNREDAKYKYYPLESDSFSVKEEKTISQVYLNSSFDIHKAKVGDPMNSVTLNVEKIVLTDGTTVLNPGTPAQPFLMNMYREYSNELNRFKLFLESYVNAAGEKGNVRKAAEGTLLPAGRYKVMYLVQPHFAIGKYRFLVEGTDDNYGNGTEFYVNNERYSNVSLNLQAGLTAGAEVLSPFFEPEKAEKKQNTSGTTGNSGSTSKAVSSSSGGSGGSSGSSGGGSGSFKVSSSFTGQVLGVDRSLSGGQWVQDEKGWWYKRPDGSYPKNSWGYEAYNGKSYWYYFLDSGYMATGWVEVNGSKYYLFPNSDGWKGRMLTGWQWIDGNCYYLDSQGQNEGALYRNTTTPDGFTVDLEGRWVVNGVVQKK